MKQNNPKTTFKRIATFSGSVSEQIYTIALLTSVAVALYSLLSIAISGNNIWMAVFSGVTLVVLLLLAFFSYRNRACKTGYTIQCILMNVVFLPLIFINCGGFQSGMPIFMILAFVFGACHPEKKASGFCLGVTFAVYVMVFMLTAWKPDIIQSLAGSNYVLSLIGAILISGFVAVALTSFYISAYRNLYKKNVLDYEQKTEMRMALLESQIENIDDIKRQRYNMRHHNQIIGEFAARHDLKGLRNYLREKQYSDEFYSKRLYCMNVEINNILTIYDRIARNKDVEMTVNAEVKSETAMEEAELTGMISTVLENAINGCVISGKAEKKIRLELKEHGCRLVLNCRNTCQEGLKDMSEYPGFPGKGIIAIERKLDTIGGILDYSIEDGEVVCRLIVDAF